jgi:hypothetical protein
MLIHSPSFTSLPRYTQIINSAKKRPVKNQSDAQNDKNDPIYSVSKQTIIGKTQRFFQIIHDTHDNYP